MAKEVVIKTIFQFKRGLSTAWTEKNPVLRAGEPGFEIDTGLLKIGRNDIPWNDLPYYNGQFTISPDGKSLQINEDGQITLYGYDDADIGQIPVKGANGLLEWVDYVEHTPIAIEDINSLLGEE
jgi:hypothetical protein